jgi:protein associated with RNAse G/E
MVTESDGRRWHSKEPAVSFFSKNDWYNVIAMIKPEGVIFYINIASPTLLDNHILKYVDYDLDFKLYPDGFIALLDQKEFIRHQTKYKYSASLIATIELMTSQIGMWLKEKRYPFNVDTVTNYYKEFKALKKD